LSVGRVCYYASFKIHIRPPFRVGIAPFPMFSASVHFRRLRFLHFASAHFAGVVVR
jgi:hypothetical protein